MSTTAPGTFAPDPRAASPGHIFLAQARIETLLFLRHGEQLLLSLVIPVGLLLILAAIDIPGHATPLDEVFPMMVAIAATSAGFTGQAIALSFDRRYGALKQLGASGVPPAAIIAGRSAAVGVMVSIQTVVLGAIALAFGWSTTPSGAVIGFITLILGAACFTVFGLLMGGTLPSEVVLALANLIWVLLVGVVGFVFFRGDLGAGTPWDLIPSVAVASGLVRAFGGTVPLPEIGIVLVWMIAAGLAVRKWFRFNS